MKFLVLIVTTGLLVMACQPDTPVGPEPGTPPDSTVTQAVATGTSPQPIPSTEPDYDLAAIISAAIDHPERPETDCDRDAQRQPAEVLALFGVRPAMSVIDLFAGGGYYTELLSRIVGPDGEVWSQNPPQFYERYGSADLDDRLAGYRLSNVVRHDLSLDDLALPPKRFDAAVAAMVLHDFFWLSDDVPGVLAQVFEAMKPGGLFLVTDHAAPDGTGAEYAVDEKGKHRIEEAYVVSLMADAGFEHVASSDVLRVPEDDRTKAFFEPGMRGKFTDRFVLVFRRVEE